MIHFSGIPSGDDEVFCWAVNKSTFIKLMNREPFYYEKSTYYANLYNYYDKLVNSCYNLDLENNHNFVNVNYDIETTDMEIKVNYTICKTHIIGLFRYAGYENHEWFKGEY